MYFNRGFIDPDINDTLLVLIPKEVNADKPSLFRPTSLCSTSVKCISKILVNRIRPFLPSLISPLQTAFVKGRQVYDSAILVQELLHAMNKKKGKKGTFAVKIDLAKAYDSLEWSFIKDCLDHFQFPKYVSNIILSCITTSSFVVSINGCKSNSFPASRGIRQGGPLSPFIFILCLEYLSFLITHQVELGNWKACYVARGGTTISQSFFADDILLFAFTNELSLITMKNILHHFTLVLVFPLISPSPPSSSPLTRILQPKLGSAAVLISKKVIPLELSWLPYLSFQAGEERIQIYHGQNHGQTGWMEGSYVVYG